MVKRMKWTVMSSCSEERRFGGTRTFRIPTGLEVPRTVAVVASRGKLSCGIGGQRDVFEKDCQSGTPWAGRHVVGKGRCECFFFPLAGMPSGDSFVFLFRFEGEPVSPFHWRRMTTLFGVGAIIANLMTRAQVYLPEIGKKNNDGFNAPPRVPVGCRLPTGSKKEYILLPSFRQKCHILHKERTGFFTRFWHGE